EPLCPPEVGDATARSVLPSLGAHGVKRRPRRRAITGVAREDGPCRNPRSWLAWSVALLGTFGPRPTYHCPVSDSADKPRVALIVSRYNGSVTGRLEAGARAAYSERLGSDEAVETITAPGAFELPQLAAAAARSGR